MTEFENFVEPHNHLYEFSHKFLQKPTLPTSSIFDIQSVDYFEL